MKFQMISICSAGKNTVACFKVDGKRQTKDYPRGTNHAQIRAELEKKYNSGTAAK